MARNPTGAERYIAKRMESPSFAKEYRAARERIDRTDDYVRHLIREIEAARSRLNITKAQLAELSDLPKESIRRLLTAGGNPTIDTFVRIVLALRLDISLKERPQRPSHRRPRGKAPEASDLPSA